MEPVSELSDAIRKGHYATKQIHCPDPLIAWSHSGRFRMGMDLAAAYLPAHARVLDHGCGDGTFLAMLVDAGTGVTATGTEITRELVEECATRFRGVDALRFILRDELTGEDHRSAYDLVTCMEVLEHVVELDAELDLLASLVKPGGVLIISVPVETGLPLMVKQTFRRIAGWRGLGDYPGDSPYTWGQFVRSVLAGGRPHMKRPQFPTGPDLPPHHTHKGFNWMVLRRKLEERFDLEAVVASPLTRLSPHLNSQAWFIVRKPEAAA